MTFAAKVRHFYWKKIRKYPYEICGRPDHLNSQIRRGCGRPVRPFVWRVPTPIWNFVVADQKWTKVTVREGAADGTLADRAEGYGGCLCPACFDRMAEEKGLHLTWEGWAVRDS